jgi:hypothetical protein
LVQVVRSPLPGRRTLPRFAPVSRHGSPRACTNATLATDIRDHGGRQSWLAMRRLLPLRGSRQGGGLPSSTQFGCRAPLLGALPAYIPSPGASPLLFVRPLGAAQAKWGGTHPSRNISRYSGISHQISEGNQISKCLKGLRCPDRLPAILGESRQLPVRERLRYDRWAMVRHQSLRIGHPRLNAHRCCPADPSSWQRRHTLSACF